MDPTSDVVGKVRAIPYLQGSIYRDLDVGLTLDYMRRRYVEPVSRHVNLETATIADCAAGFGWVSFAFLLAGVRKAILFDVDANRLEAARDLACVLGVAGRCRFEVAELQRLPLHEDSVDIFASIETLEHVGSENIVPAVEVIARSTRRAVVLTTPNFLFPIVAHDTQLPLAHWMPGALRRRYAAMFDKSDCDHGNHFVRPWQLTPLARKFSPTGRYQTFETLEEFDRFYPHYLPYGKVDAHRYRLEPHYGLRSLHRVLATMLGPWSFLAAPSLASLWLRRRHK